MTKEKLPTTTIQLDPYGDVEALLQVLPSDLRDAVRQAGALEDLIEVILDLGRVPTARFGQQGEVVLRDREVTREEIQYVVDRVGEFDADNRAGIERTLHRIAAIRNRRGDVVGLTCRVGRAVYGTVDIIRDLIESGKNVLLLGRPGVGKTTMLREAARILAEKKRVVIVDTSNEIGGDGDVPHPAIGRARRMQVPTPALQHEVMIEAVENHNPEVIIIDEIGRELEAMAARTIAERGVQLIATAHGNTLENLLLNPTLSDLVGGIESVTLSDEEARRRGTQKTVLERRAPPTFDILVEIQDRNRLVVHKDVAEAVDALLRGYPVQPELRYRDEQGQIHIEYLTPPPGMATRRKERKGPRRQDGTWAQWAGATASAVAGAGTSRGGNGQERRAEDAELEAVGVTVAGREPVRIYPYGVARDRLMRVARRLNVPAIVVKDLGQAEALVTLRSYYRKRQRAITDAEARGLPIYVLRSNTTAQIERFLGDLFHLREADDMDDLDLDDVVEITQKAIDAVLKGRRSVELPPAPPEVRRMQHEMAREAHLRSKSTGTEPYRRVVIYQD